jgi:hypothetical protein
MTTQPSISGRLILIRPFVPSQKAYNMPEKTEGAVTKVTVSFLGKTYTQEELEYIATRHVAEKFGLPNADLLAIAAEHHPPPEWYKTKEEMPF